MNEAFARFTALFNAAQFFEAHEVLEDLWRETAGEEKAFYQGMIQAAVALHHHANGNRRGAEYELQKCKEKLQRYFPTYAGVNLVKLVEQLDAALLGKDFPKIVLNAPSS